MLRKPVHKVENKVECAYGQKCKDYMTKKCNHCENNIPIHFTYYKATNIHLFVTSIIGFIILMTIVALGTMGITIYG